MEARNLGGTMGEVWRKHRTAMGQARRKILVCEASKNILDIGSESSLAFGFAKELEAGASTPSIGSGSS
jgi:hypothetical protein